MCDVDKTFNSAKAEARDTPKVSRHPRHGRARATVARCVLITAVISVLFSDEVRNLGPAVLPPCPALTLCTFRKQLLAALSPPTVQPQAQTLEDNEPYSTAAVVHPLQST